MARSVDEHRQEIQERRQEILGIYRRHYPNHDTARIEEAMDYAELLHRGQMRRSGSPYIFHPLEVTRLVAEAQLDEPCLVSAMLHDTIEDAVASNKSISARFTPYIGGMVEALTKIRTASVEGGGEEGKQLTYKKILAASSKDIRPLLIKIFDRQTNMRDLHFMPEKSQKRISTETLNIYVPLARRLGMSLVERELTNQALSFLYPEDYDRISRRVASERIEREQEIMQMEETLLKAFEEQGIKIEIHPYWPEAADFYKEEEGLSPDADIVVKIRLQIDNLIQIYTGLGILHTMYSPVPMAVKDWLGSPRANGYRALETKVVVNRRIYEFALLTHEMNGVNERGIVHNWKRTQNRLSGYYTSYMRLLEEMLADEEVRVNDVLQLSGVDGVAVYSPRKDIFILPKMATVLDFAYEVHRQVGDHAKAGLVNGVERPIHQTLASGDIVQIITDEKVHPQENWQNFAVTSKSRQAIKHWLKRQMESRAVDLGREMFMNELEKYGRDPNVVLESEDFAKLLQGLKQKPDELFRRIGYRQIMASDFIEQHGIVPMDLVSKRKKAERNSIRNKLFSTLKSQRGPRCRFTKDDIFVKYSQCCSPIFGDHVVGVLSEGKGIVVHRDGCPSLASVPDSERIEVEWDMETGLTSAVLNLHLSDEKGVLAKILNLVNKSGVNMSEFNAYTVDREAFMRIRLDVNGQRQLLRIVNEFRKIDAVKAITREE